MIAPVVDAALVFGATGRLGKVLLQGLAELGIRPVIITRRMLSDYQVDGVTRRLPERLAIIDASIDYSDMGAHEARKQSLVMDLARRHDLRLVASFSSGVVEFDDSLIVNPSYSAYKRIKQDNLTFFQSLGARLFYPKIYTVVGPCSFKVKSTGWVQVLEQSLNSDTVSIAHPHEPRSWISERCVRRLFTTFAAGEHPDYLETPACGTFTLDDVVSFCEARRGQRIVIQPGCASPWLSVPYVARNPSAIDACNCVLNAELASLLDHAADH